MAHLPADDLQRSIEKFILERFESGMIMSIEVEDDRARSEEAVVDITVVFKGTPIDFARREPPGFIAKLRAFVGDAHHAFPVVRFRPA